MEFFDNSSQDSINEDSINEDSTSGPISKKRRSNNNDQLKIFENIAKDMKDSQNKKMEFIQQFVQPKTELELFFASLCKTVEKFNPLAQAKAKISISNIVSQMEIEHLENMMTVEAIESLPIMIDK